MITYKYLVLFFILIILICLLIHTINYNTKYSNNDYDNFNNDNVFVINLERRKDRLKFVNNQLQKNNIKYTRFNAFDGKKLHQYKNEIDLYINKNSEIMKNNGQIGCSLSHLILWEKVVEKKMKHALIFEDDVIILDNFNERLNNIIKELPEDYNLVLLGGTTMKGSLIDGKQYILQGANYPEFNWCLHAYLINYKFAEKLLIDIKNNKLNKILDSHLSYNIYPHNKFYISSIPITKQEKKFKTDIIPYENMTTLLITF